MQYSQKCHYSLARTNNVLYYLQEIQEALEKVSEECLENKFYVKVSYMYGTFIMSRLVMCAWYMYFKLFGNWE